MKKNICYLLFIVFSLPLFAQPPSLEELREDDENQRRDLSMPGSRIVINTFAFYGATPATTASEFSNSPALPLNIGYLSTERIGERKMDNILTLYRYNQEASTPQLETGWSADLTTTANWNPETGSTLEVVSNGLKLSVNSDANPDYKSLTPISRIPVEIDKTPILTIYIPKATGKWSLKVTNTQNEEVTLHPDASGTGVFEYDLSQLTSWTGSQRLILSLWAIGRESYMIIEDLRFIGMSSKSAGEEAEEYSTAWLPNELPFSATYSSGTTIQGTDFFYDKYTLIRKIEFNSQDQEEEFILGGYYTGSVISSPNTLIKVDNGTFSFAINSDIPTQSGVTFYKSLVEMKNQINGSELPDYGPYWGMKFKVSDLTNKTFNTALAFSYVNDGEETDILTQRVATPFETNNIETKYQEGKDYWNDFLQKVPCPSNFSIETVDNKDITPEQVRQNYYAAWVFVGQNVMDPDPVNFPYHQVITGKSSMWDESDDRAPYSATWESFFGIQFYGFIDPDVAWDSFIGLMSLTDDDGFIGGESLPSRKAQTAWLLYQLTENKQRLEEVYAPLERYLNWRLIYPHWIYNSYPDVRLKDAEFAFSAIIDIDFMMKISAVIKDQATVEAWKKKKEDFYQECLPWFWTAPNDFPVQYYNTETHVRSAGHAYWVTSGLHMDIIQDPYLKSMYNMLAYYFNSKNNFGGTNMGFPKYPDVSYTLYGLFEKGYTAKAENVIDVCIRDLVRAGGWFSEQYETEGIPYPTGVRPSLFGASMMIDFVMAKNGFRYDMGTPYLQNAFKKKASITGIRYGEKTLNIECDENGKFNISGDYVDDPYEIITNYGDCKVITKDGSIGITEQIAEKEELEVTNNESGQPIAFVNLPLNQSYSLNLYNMRGYLHACLANNVRASSAIDIYLLDNLPPQLYLLALEYSNKRQVKKIRVSN